MSATVPQLSIEDLAVLMVGEVQRAMQSSELEQVRRWTELVASVSATEDGYVATAVGHTPVERANAALRRAQETLLPLLLDGRKGGDVITLSAEGRDLLLRELAGITIEQADARVAPRPTTIAELVRPTRVAARPWAVDRFVVVAFVEAKLVAEARASYRLLRAAVQRGVPRVSVTAGALDAKVTLALEAARSAGGAVRMLAQVVDAQSASAKDMATLIGNLRLEFRVATFPELTAP